MTYEVYGTGGNDAKIRVEGIAAEVKVAWGVNVVNSNVSYLVLYVDVPYQQGLQIRYTAWYENGNVSRGPINITPCNGDNYRYDISVYNCNFVTAGYDHSDPQKKVFTANNGNLYYLWTDEMQQQVRAYFDNYVPGQGVGEVTLQTDAPSQLLTFTSRELGKSFKYWIRGNLTIELYTPGVEPSELIIFRNGAFADAVIDGFDITDYKEYVASGAGAWNPQALAQWFRTKYGLVFRQPNAAVFQIQNSRLVKPYTGDGDVGCIQLIPINRTRGEYTKLRVNAALLARESSIDPLIRSRVCWVSSDGTTLELPSAGVHSAHNYDPQVNVFEEYGDEISDIDYIDYITVEGVTATVAYDSIKLIKDSVNASEVPRNVIFENGHWGSGVTTDFDFSGKEFGVSTAEVTITAYPEYYFSKYLVRIHHTGQQSPYIINDNKIYKADNGVYGSDRNQSNIYIPLKRASGYTKIKVKMGQTSTGSGGQNRNYVSCSAFYVTGDRSAVSAGYFEVLQTVGVNEYEVDISSRDYIDYITLGSCEGTCVWESIVLE